MRSWRNRCYLKSQLFAVTPHDAFSYLAVLPVLAAATLLACAVPALRAARVSPTEALRGEQAALRCARARGGLLGAEKSLLPLAASEGAWDSIAGCTLFTCSFLSSASV